MLVCWHHQWTQGLRPVYLAVSAVYQLQPSCLAREILISCWHSLTSAVSHNTTIPCRANYHARVKRAASHGCLITLSIWLYSVCTVSTNNSTLIYIILRPCGQLLDYAAREHSSHNKIYMRHRPGEQKEHSPPPGAVMTFSWFWHQTENYRLTYLLTGQTQCGMCLIVNSEGTGEQWDQRH